MGNVIKDRVAALREYMKQHGLDAFILPSSDPHHGEYVPEHWKGREWISGFNGSAGIAVVTAEKAALWTDSRYFIAAAAQLQDTGFTLMKEKMPDTPPINKWIGEALKLQGGKKVGIDGMVASASEVKSLKDSLKCEGDFSVVTELDPLNEVWVGRPDLPLNKVDIYDLCFAGEPAHEKLNRIREKLSEINADGTLVSSLDDIAWTLNLRGSDVHCNPVFVSYLLVAPDSATLFIDNMKIDEQVRSYLLQEGVDVMEYDDVRVALEQYSGSCLLLDPNQVNYNLFNAAKCKVVEAASPVPYMKAVKNRTEVEGMRNAMLRDGVAMETFCCWLESAVKNGRETELSIDRKLTELRAEQQFFKGLSFDTIAAYGEHGAIVHYEATPETDVPLRKESFLLLDSGAQYLDGTTDITRTIPLGNLSEYEREIYTLVLKAHIQLEMLKFPSGASGTQLDAVARKVLWEKGLNYLHGTGHGVGAYLNVHEGPHQIRMEYKPAPMIENMTVTNEPGMYLEGRFGVRIENTMIVKMYKETEFGKFLEFEPLTLCHIDTQPIIMEMMTQEELEWLNNYHSMVYERLSPYLHGEVAVWLKEKTAPVTK